MPAKKPARKEAKTVRDLPLKADQVTSVKGGKLPKHSSILMGSCATGVHVKEATITV